MTHDELIESATKAAQHAFHFADENGCDIDACWLEAMRAAIPLIRADERAKENKACAAFVEECGMVSPEAESFTKAVAERLRSRMRGE